MSSMIHRGRDGTWKRCIAETRLGGGCEDCPIPTGRISKTTIFMSVPLLAGIGGGTITRSGREDCIVSEIDYEQGIFSRGTETRKHYYDAQTGERVSWRDRKSEEKSSMRARKAAVAMPNPDVVKLNFATDDEFKEFFERINAAQDGRYGGVKVDEYNRPRVEKTVSGAMLAIEQHEPKNVRELDDRRRHEFENRFIDSALLFAEVKNYDAEKAVDAAMQNFRWGQYHPDVLAEKERVRAEEERKRKREMQRAQALGQLDRGRRGMRLTDYSTPPIRSY